MRLTCCVLYLQIKVRVADLVGREDPLPSTSPEGKASKEDQTTEAEETPSPGKMDEIEHTEDQQSVQNGVSFRMSDDAQAGNNAMRVINSKEMH